MASLDSSIVWIGARDLWRAQIGRLPRAYEARLRRCAETYGLGRVSRAISATAAAGHRRTADRWAFFLALFGEAP